MALPLPESLFDAERMSRSREVMATNFSTAELRELGAEVLARSVFTARGTNAIYAGKIKEVVDELAGGRMSFSQARAALYQTLQALGYTPEGGFPGDEGEVPPAIAGSLQDLSSFRRLDLIVRTQLELMQGAGEQWRGHQPAMLTAFPAWELVRIEDREVPRDWPARWRIAGGQAVNGGRMIALKGDPIWGELGSYGNFADALGVDHPPFAFNSGMGWRSVSDEQVRGLGITGPEGETPEDWFASEPVTMGGALPKLAKPRLSLEGVPAPLIERFKAETFATPTPGKAGSVDFSDLLADSLKEADAAYGKGGSQ